MRWTRDHTFPSQDAKREDDEVFAGTFHECFFSAELSLVGHNTMFLFLDKFGPLFNQKIRKILEDRAFLV